MNTGHSPERHTSRVDKMSGDISMYKKKSILKNPIYFNRVEKKMSTKKRRQVVNSDYHHNKIFGE